MADQGRRQRAPRPVDLLALFRRWWLDGGATDGAPAKAADRRQGKPEQGKKRGQTIRNHWDGQRWRQTEITAGS